MKIIVSLMLLVSSIAVACPKGTISDDGACRYENVAPAEESAKWVSDEKPPKSGMAGWQDGALVHVTDAPSMKADDAKQDQERAQADHEGKVAAGIVDGKKP